MSLRTASLRTGGLVALLVATLASPAFAQVPPPPPATAPLPPPATAPLPPAATAPLPPATAPLSPPPTPFLPAGSAPTPGAAAPGTPAFGAPAGPGGPPVFLPPPGPQPDSAGGVLASEAADQFKRKKRMIIAGASIFGLSYYASLVASSVGVSRNKQGSKEYIAGLFPIAGPFITAVSRGIPDANKPGGDFEGVGLYLGLGVGQLLGAGLFIAGLRLPTGRSPDPCKDRINAALYSPGAAGEDTPPYRPCASISASFQPIVTPTFTGGGLTGTF